MEANYVGLYYLARAGYEIDDVSMARTHPTSAKQFLRLEEATKEIKAKIAAEKPLMPKFEKELPSLQKAPNPSESDKETPSN